MIFGKHFNAPMLITNPVLFKKNYISLITKTCFCIRRLLLIDLRIFLYAVHDGYSLF